MCIMDVAVDVRDILQIYRLYCKYTLLCFVIHGVGESGAASAGVVDEPVK